jgi:heme exporter protein CcmD
VTADFSHDHWDFVWAAYGVTALVFGALIVVSIARLRHWAQAAKAEKEPQA